MCKISKYLLEIKSLLQNSFSLDENRNGNVAKLRKVNKISTLKHQGCRNQRHQRRNNLRKDVY